MIGWVDASSGASGDMLLGALLGAGVPPDVLEQAVSAVAPEPVSLRAEQVHRNGFAATRCHVGTSGSTTRRTWPDVAALLAEAPLGEPTRGRSHATFEALALAEAAVHGVSPTEVVFHEVGALDAIADVVGVCAGLAHLDLDSLTVSPVAVGSGRVRGEHGEMPVPPPAVAELLRGVPSHAGPVAAEMCTPTGAALLSVNATGYGPQPAMVTDRVGLGAGGRDVPGHANILRLFLGEPYSAPAATEHGTADPRLVEANVDDLDPRLWPQVIAALLAAGASDAWLTPILMKKGRPAHTLSVLVTGERADAVRAEIFTQTSTIGVRESAVAKTALERETRRVVVDGHQIRVKVARHAGAVLNSQPEYDDVAAVAAATGRPVKDVLSEAAAASHALRADRT